MMHQRRLPSPPTSPPSSPVPGAWPLAVAVVCALSWGLTPAAHGGSGCHGDPPDPLPLCDAGDDRPNIVMVMFDDLGSGDLSPYSLTPPAGSGYHAIDTPRIEELANEGMVFDQYYVTPTCSPTRTSLLSGGYQQRVNVRKQLQLQHSASNRGIPASLTALPEMLRQEGYTTAHFGKWHSGFSKAEFRPLAMGFHEACTLQGSLDPSGVNGWGEHGLVYCNPGVRDGDTNFGIAVPGYTSAILVDYAADFIARAKTQECPFFIQIWLWAPHAALNWDDCPTAEKATMDALRTKYFNLGVLGEGRKYAAIVERADSEIGRLRDILASQEILDETLFLVASDNGGVVQFGNNPGTGDPSLIPTNGDLTGFKGQVYEGGIRSPLIARWGTNIPQSTLPGCDPNTDPLCPYTRHREPVMRFELYATLAELAGANMSQLRFDGQSFAGTLTDPTSSRQQDVLVWEQQRFNFGFSDDDQQWNDWAVRKGDWKAIYDHDCTGACTNASTCQCTSGIQLFDLAASPTETSSDDLSATAGGPDRIAALQEEYYDWRRRVGRLPLETGIVGGAKLQDRDLRTVSAASPGQFLRLDGDARYDFFDANFSFSARIFPDVGTLAAPGCTMNCKTMIATKPGSWEMTIIGTRQVQLTLFDDGGTAQVLVSDQTVQEGQWNWVAFTVYGWKGTDSLARLYTNSLTPKACSHQVVPLIAPCTTDVAAVQRNDNRVTVGGDFSGQRQFEGTMRDIAFYVSSLQDEELRRLFEDFDNELFFDSFETGLGAWQPAVVQGSSSLGLGGPGFIDNNLLEIDINAAGDRAFLTTLVPQDEERIRLSFALDLNQVTLTDSVPQRILVARKVDGAMVQNVFWIDLQAKGSGHEARVMARQDLGGFKTSAWVPFDGTVPQTFEVAWRKADAAFGDGRIRLRVGDREIELRGIDNDQPGLDIDRLDLGLITGAAAGTSGTLLFDQFETYRF